MTERFFTITMTDLVHDDDFDGGRRFVTDWKGSDDRFWRVSSVENSRALETMIFATDGNGEVDYFDLDCVKEFIGSREEQGRFLQGFLERQMEQVRQREIEAFGDGSGHTEPMSISPHTTVLMDRFCDLYGGVAIDEMDEDEGRPH